MWPRLCSFVLRVDRSIISSSSEESISSGLRGCPCSLQTVTGSLSSSFSSDRSQWACRLILQALRHAAESFIHSFAGTDTPHILHIGHCWMIKEICLFGETDQFIRNHKHCCSAASCGCGIFWSLPCCWLGCTSMCSQVHICSLWNASCTSNTLLRRHGSLGDSNLRALCQMWIGAVMTASLLHCLQGCDSSTPSNKDCSLIQSIAQTPWTPPSTLPPHQGTLVTVVDSPLPSDGC